MDAPVKADARSAVRSRDDLAVLFNLQAFRNSFEWKGNKTKLYLFFLSADQAFMKKFFFRFLCDIHLLFIFLL